MKNNFIPALRLTLVCMVFFCGIYTLSLLGIGNIAPKSLTFSKNEHGFYENVGQSFTDDRYFNSRPSAVDYNAAGSGGSNKGPSNPDYLALVEARIDTFLVHNPGVKKEDIPADLVTASGSGIDPHISVKAAEVQIKRIAQIRNIDEARLVALVNDAVERPFLGAFGPEKINVIKLNLSLDALK